MSTRTVVLRAVQRERSQRVNLTAYVEINGHQYAVPQATAAIVNPDCGLLGVEAAQRLTIAVASEIRAWDALLPLWGER